MIQQAVFEILRDIVVNWPVTCTRLNTFFVMTGPDDLVTDNAHKTYEDYINGHYWTRQGVTRDKTVFEYDVLHVEVKEADITTPSNAQQGFALYKFMISISRQLGCEGCEPGCEGKRTQIMLEQQGLNDLGFVVKQLYDYRLVTLEHIATEQQTTALMNSHRVACLTEGDDPEYVLISDCDPLHIPAAPLNMYISRFPGSLENLISVTTEISIGGCVQDVALVCSPTLPADDVAITNCAAC